VPSSLRIGKEKRREREKKERNNTEERKTKEMRGR